MVGWNISTLQYEAQTLISAGGGGGGDASAANQLLGNASLASILAKIPALGQALAAASTPVVLTAAQVTTLTPPAAITGFATESTLDTRLGSLTEVAPATDTASSGLNGRLQRIAQRLTSLIALLPAALVGGRLDSNTGAWLGSTAPSVGQKAMASSVPVVLSSDQAAIPVTASAGTNLNTSLLALESTQGAGNVLTGAVTEAAPATDTASSGLNGRLQRIAQRLTTLLAVFPATIAVNSGLKDVSTLRVVLATDQPALTNKLLVTPDSVALPANQSVNAAQFGGTNVSTGTGAGGAGIPRVTVSSDSNVGVTPPTLTKATQGATGFSTQDLKDAGRNQTNYFTALGIAATTAEVMQSLTGYKAGAAVGATATPAVVTAGKTYRVTSITLSYQSLATAGSALLRLRANLSGVGVVGSPLVMTFTIGSAAAVAGVTTTLDIPFPDGLEFAAGTGIAVGVIGLNAAGVAGTAAGFVSITIYGYEY